MKNETRTLVEQRIFNIMLLFTCTISIVFLIEGHLIASSQLNIVIWFISLSVSILIYTYCNIKEYHTALKNFFFLFLIFFIMPIGILQSAQNSPLSTAYVFILMLSVHYFFRGIQRTTLIGLTILIATALLVYQSQFPDQFFSYSQQELTINIIIQIPLALGMASFMLSRFADSMNLNNKVLETLSTHDDLTNIYNRRFIYDYLDKLETVASQETPAYIGLVDVDCFKKINDTYGHNIGDKVMRLVAKHIKQTTGHSGIVGRYGGDEFIIIFTNCNKKPCQSIIRRMNNLLHIQKELNLDEPVTLSGGFALFDNSSTIDQVLAKADERLYVAKSNGKNKIIFHS